MSEPPKLDLKNVLREERKEKLAPVPDDFYEKAQQLIQELETDLSRADPESAKYQMIEDELITAKKNLNSILETRMAKINYEASVRKSLKRQENSEPENMTPEERELYNVLYTTMKDWRSARLNLLVRNKEAVKEIGKEMASAVQPPPAPVTVKKPEVKRDIKDYIVVRVLRDVPTFAGMDGRNYTLAKEDVATVPVVNAETLIKRGVAVKLPAGGRLGKA